LDAAQWRGAIEAAGFTVCETERWPLRLAFNAWVERMRTPAAAVAAIRMLQQGAPREVRTALAFEADGSFIRGVGLLWSRGAGSGRYGRLSPRRDVKASATRWAPTQRHMLSLLGILVR